MGPGMKAGGRMFDFLLYTPIQRVRAFMTWEIEELGPGGLELQEESGYGSLRSSHSLSLAYII